ncbi:hypothetical protein JOQ06_018940 [Pogonophryne albipinna]|uniref:Uncharacterized protein n=1 Tax=Pogonophryne albipinna TaxID=1090488 RepID=A0AAD6ATI8_9TELE|nr:hypothetical protein JOQ06_018940 [Pogonophryne albipinna]
MQADILRNSDGLSAVTDKMEYAEGQSRRSNVVLDGIGVEPGETWAQTEEKVKDILVDKLKFQRGIEIERAHRTGKPAANNTRPIVVKFLRFKDRSAVLERAKHLRGTNIYINEDYTEADELDETTCVWHSHVIRPSKNDRVPSGRPKVMFKHFGTTYYLYTIMFFEHLQK